MKGYILKVNPEIVERVDQFYVCLPFWKRGGNRTRGLG